MDLNDQFCLDHLIFKERICRSCNKNKSLMDDFYLTRKDRNTYLSSYSYECKECTIKRVMKSKKYNDNSKWGYPDW